LTRTTATAHIPIFFERLEISEAHGVCGTGKPKKISIAIDGH
jgi:hypothetical protein